MFFSYFILMSTFIPISLVISLEFVKVFQGMFIDSDRLMYSEERKQGVTVKTVSLNEELGQIQYVFSDKTGTLTKNQMEFKIALIGDYVYGD
jgi:P-type E1-E2 ATPase